MDQQHLQNLTRSLKEEKKLIEDQLKHIANKNPDVKDDWQAKFRKAEPSATPDEQAQSVTNWDQRRAVEQSLEERLKEVNDALERIENGTYGICIRCDNKIDDRRLQASPVSSRCLECTTKLEHQIM